MSLSFQTNVTSLVAENNLLINNQNQANAITQLTSGYRINNSGDDPAGLAVANGLRSQIAELTEGVGNANDGVAVLQTIDGGLNNISTILDTLTTLATQSASATFSGDRSTVNNEYQSLLSEITRQATNIGLNAGGTYNSNVGVYIGGATSAANAQVTVNLSGATNAVDATSLGLANTSVVGATELTGNAVNLNNPTGVFLAGGTQAFTFNIANATGAPATVVATLTGGAAGLSGTQVVASLNSQLNASGITASIGSNGQLEFGGTASFTLGAVGAASAGNAAATAASTITANTTNYNIDSAFAAVVGTDETGTFQNANGTYDVDLSAVTGATAGAAIQALNTQLHGSGITAVLGANGTDINFQSATSFSVNETALAGTSGGLWTGLGAQTVNAPSTGAGSTGNAQAALVALSAAVQSLGLVQGAVGSGEQVLADAIGLANSQITNKSAAESQIRDANIAQQAAALTNSQTLEQSSVAALAQANAAPQLLLKLLQS